ncbi:toxin [Erwinia sp. CGal63]|uniref:toxin n=1 Tax=Erwinia sp. CGal63 TaxID=2919889 RepID=UPI00300845CE
MDAVFVELPPFARHRAEYLSDEAFRSLQNLLLLSPCCGDVMQHTGGLRKLRLGDDQRHKGKRSGLRVIYYWWQERSHFLLFTLYSKGEMGDLTCTQKSQLRHLLDYHIAETEP